MRIFGIEIRKIPDPIKVVRISGWDIKELLGGRFVGIEYADLIGDVRRELQESIDKALNNDVESNQIIIDPGIGFGKYGDEYVRIALIENEKRIRQAAKNIKKFLKDLEAGKL